METNHHKNSFEDNNSSSHISFYFTGRQTIISDGLRNFIKNRLDKLNQLFKKDNNIKVNVILTSGKTECHTRITLTTDHYTDTSIGAHKDLYRAIEQACSLLIKTISRRHDKFRHQRPNSLSLNESLSQEQIAFNYSTESLSEELDKSIEASMFNLFPGSIIQEKSEKIKTLTPKEAIIEMRMKNASCRIFRNSETSSLSMLYRREDGNYGLIKIHTDS